MLMWLLARHATPKSQPQGHRVRGHCRGFTLLEIMIAVLIISILAAMALPMLTRARRNAFASTFVSDLRVASMAFQQYPFANNGLFPADAAPGVMPAGMADYLTKMNWTEATSLGGQWDWDPTARAVAAVGVTWSDQDMADMVDKLIDDGNITTGSFKKSADGTAYLYLIDN